MLNDDLVKKLETAKDARDAVFKMLPALIDDPAVQRLLTPEIWRALQTLTTSAGQSIDGLTGLDVPPYPKPLRAESALLQGRLTRSELENYLSGYGPSVVNYFSLLIKFGSIAEVVDPDHRPIDSAHIEILNKFVEAQNEANQTLGELLATAPELTDFDRILAVYNCSRDDPDQEIAGLITDAQAVLANYGWQEPDFLTSKSFADLWGQRPLNSEGTDQSPGYLMERLGFMPNDPVVSRILDALEITKLLSSSFDDQDLELERPYPAVREIIRDEFTNSQQDRRLSLLALVIWTEVEPYSNLGDVVWMLDRAGLILGGWACIEDQIAANRKVLERLNEVETGEVPYHAAFSEWLEAIEGINRDLAMFCDDNIDPYAVPSFVFPALHKKLTAKVCEAADFAKMFNGEFEGSEQILTHFERLQTLCFNSNPVETAKIWTAAPSLTATQVATPHFAPVPPEALNPHTNDAVLHQ